MNKEDKRVRRTRKALAKALIALTIEQGYEKVTIQEITDRAGVGYRTFFRHYADKDALLFDVLQTTLAELRPMIITQDFVGKEGYRPLPAQNGRIIFEYIAGNSDLYRVLLSSGSVALEPLKAYAYREAITTLEQVPDLPIPPSILAQHMVATIFSLLQWWLENNMPYPPEEIAAYLERLLAIPAA
ncbi:MAG: TetR/AcrR family transcriptional regulator [Candidatus Promineifilaceae bacterium]